MRDLARKDIGNGFDTAMRMPREASRVAGGVIIAEIVEQEKWIEFGGVLKAERAVQVHACTFQRGDCGALFQNGSDRHGKSPFEQHIGSHGAVEMAQSVRG